MSWVPAFTQWCLTGVSGGVTVQPTSALYWEFWPLRVGRGLRRVGDAAGWSEAVMAAPVALSCFASVSPFQHLILRSLNSLNSSFLLEVRSNLGEKIAAAYARNRAAVWHT